jgi:uncharacterized protein (TIGR00725 family)
MSDIYVSVIGSSSCDDEQRAQAEEVGRLLAVAGCIVVCGGMDSGVMAAVARGAMRGGGRSIGLLPDLDRRHASPDLTFSLCTGIGHGRNLAVAASGDVVIAVGGEWGTLSEIGLARSVGRPVVLLSSWDVRPAAGESDGLLHVSTPEEAVALALSLAKHKGP